MSRATIYVPEPGQVIETDWRGYLKILAAVQDRRVHVTYDRGRLEIMSPSGDHEQIKTFLRMFIETTLIELGIDFRPGGSMTFRRRDLQRGLEPDECYWVANWEAVDLRKKRYNPLRHPPPDLAIEVEVTTTVLNRLGIYRALGVPEIWRWTEDGRLIFLVRSDSGEPSYEERPRSLSLPQIDPADIVRQVQKAPEQSTSRWIRELRVWLQSKR